MRGYDVVDLSTDMILFTTTHRKHLPAPMCEVGTVSSPVAHARKLTLRERECVPQARIQTQI